MYLNGRIAAVILTFVTLITNLCPPCIGTFRVRATQEKMFTWGEKSEILNNNNNNTYSDIFRHNSFYFIVFLFLSHTYDLSLSFILVGVHICLNMYLTLSCCDTRISPPGINKGLSYLILTAELFFDHGQIILHLVCFDLNCLIYFL